MPQEDTFTEKNENSQKTEEQSQSLQELFPPASNNNAAPTQKPPVNIKKEVLSWLLHFAAAILLVFVIQTFIFVPVRVEGSSMADTLHDDEFLFATRYDYLLGDPQRQDVVICHYPNRTRKVLGGLFTMPENFVKRIIGMPGDTIEIKYDLTKEQNIVYINGQPLNEPYLTAENNKRLYPMEPVVLGEDEYFVIGDNRDNSNDSRNLQKVGSINRKDIVSHVRFVFFPFNQWRTVQ